MFTCSIMNKISTYEVFLFTFKTSQLFLSFSALMQEKQKRRGYFYSLRRLDPAWLWTMRGGSVLWYGGVVLNRMSLGTAWSSMELWELAYDEALRLLHTLSSDSVRYSERLGDRPPAADTCGRRTTVRQRHQETHSWSALPFCGHSGLPGAGGRRGHRGINYTLCSEGNKWWSTAGECLTEVVTEVTSLWQQGAPSGHGAERKKLWTETNRRRMQAAARRRVELELKRFKTQTFVIRKTYLKCKNKLKWT